MDSEAQKLDALEQELKRDLDAITRVKKMMAFKNGLLSSPADDRQMALPVPADPADNRVITLEADLEFVPAASLRGTIEAIINKDADVRWTVQKMLKYLRDINFNLKATKPLFSVGQAMKKLADSKRIRLVYRGTGSEPYIYKGLAPPKETEVHSVNHAQAG